MKQKQTIVRHLAYYTMLTVCVGIVALPAYALISDDELEEIVQEAINKDRGVQKLNTEIEEKSSAIEELTEKKHAYEENIKEKQQEKLTLESQLSVLDDTIEGTKVDIQKSEIELDVLQDDIEVLEDEIHATEQELNTDRTQLSGLVRELYAYDQRSPIELAFSEPTFSAFYSQLEYTNRVQTSIQRIVKRLEGTKKQLHAHQELLIDTKSEVSKKKTELELTQKDLEGEQVYKEKLLDETEATEESFQQLLQKVQAQQAQIEGQISSLQQNAQTKIATIRDELEKKIATDDGAEEVFEADQEFVDGVVNFIWPIESRTITCGFHCGGYPFSSWIGQHSGIDVATQMGSSVEAAASGYVARAVYDGTSNLAWVMIIHPNGLSTVYMHLSDVDVGVDEYVTRGQVIGKSGGMPGTPGAGPYSTGAHLHFEIRVDGVPTDPMQYLP